MLAAVATPPVAPLFTQVRDGGKKHFAECMLALSAGKKK